jgi:transcriptional regulator with XRE-family HTH domain
VTGEKPYYRTLGRSIRAVRRSAGRTQEDLADDVKLSRTSITNIESGNQPVSVWMLHKIAISLGCDPAELLRSTAELPVSEWPADLTPRTEAVIRRLASGQ